MKVGFLGFGEVASTLSEGLQKHGAIVATCIEGRSMKTKSLVEKSSINLYKTNIELAKSSDILISTVIPSQAIKVAQEVGKYVNGIYVDINNVSPKTVKKTLSFIENRKIVDASIIGSIRKGLNVSVIASGDYATQFAELNNYGMNISIVGEEIGQASTIKMFRSSFTKGISALLFETLYSAYKMGIDEEVLKYIAETECEGFKDSAISRIISSSVHAKRRGEEMEEVIELISEYTPPKMSTATEELFKSIYEHVNDLETRPHKYREVFKLIDKNEKK